MTRERFVEKLRRYAEWYRAGRSLEALGFRRFRVLTLTRSFRGRCASLVAATRADSTLGDVAGMYWFTAAQPLACSESAGVLGAVWQVATASDERFSLVPHG